MRWIRIALTLASLACPGIAAAAGLVAVPSFGPNPGALQMFKYVPANMPTHAPLIVLLHGCTSSAQGFVNAGFNQIADDRKIYLIYAQQTSSNNPVSCFNWAGEYGDPANMVRGQGENQSIKEMIDRMKADHSIDASRVYVVGFSAGGAFAAVMLATWPDLFAGGAIMSGVPYRCAASVQGAYDCMAIGNHPELKHTPREWGDRVRTGYPAFTGMRPPVILFHGTTDTTVHPDNLTELVEQWTDASGTDAMPDSTEMVGSHQRTTYLKDGVAVVEAWRIAGMGHAVTIGPRAAEHPCGATGPYLEDRGLCAAYEVARFFGLESGGAGAGGGMAGSGMAGGGMAGGGMAGSGMAGGGMAGGGMAGPSVRITSPADGALVSGWVEIKAEADAAGGVQRVEFKLDGMSRAADTVAPYAYRWQTALATPGRHTLAAVAFDELGDSASAQIMVTVAEGSTGGAGTGPAGHGAAGSDATGEHGQAGNSDGKPGRVDPIACAGTAGARAGAPWLAMLLAAACALRGRRRRSP